MKSSLVFRHARRVAHAVVGPVQARRLYVGAVLMLSAVLLTSHPARAARQADASAAPTVPMCLDWKYTTDYYGSNPAAPIITDGVAYFAAGNRFYAVDAKTGALKWRYPDETTLPTVIQTTPVLNADTLFFGAGDGLYALSRADGKPRWAPYHLKNGVTVTPILLGDNIFFGAGNGLIYALDSKTGDPVPGIWQRGVDGGGDFSSDFVVADNIAYYVTNGQTMHARSLISGRERWVDRLPAALRNNVEPVLSGESIYIAGSNTLTSWRVNNGAQRWYKPLPSDAATAPAIDANGNIYVITTDHNIYALDKSGRGLWKQPAQIDYEVNVPPAVVGDVLLVGAAQGGLYAFDAGTGALRWNCQIHPSQQNTSNNNGPNNFGGRGGPGGQGGRGGSGARGYNGNFSVYTNVSATPVFSDGTLYVLTDDGSLCAFRSDAPDTTPPTVTDLQPTLGDYLSGRPPFYFRARITDDGSGLKDSTITLKVDDQTIARRSEYSTDPNKLGFVFHPQDGMLEYYTLEREAARSSALTDGHHTVTITASDWMGNSVTKTWGFYIDDTIPKRENINNTNTQNGVQRPGGRGGLGGPGGPGGAGGLGGKG